MNCGHCHQTDKTIDHVRLCAIREHAARANARAVADGRVVNEPERFPCETGPAGIGCSVTRIPGVAGTGWDGQKFRNLFECPRCKGKGWQTFGDTKRNEKHDELYIMELLRRDGLA